MINSSIKTFSTGIFSFYVYYSNLLLGWQFVSFIFIYQSTDPGDILNRVDKCSAFSPYLLSIGALLSIIILILQRLSPISYLHNVRDFPKVMIVQNLFLILLFFNYLTVILNIHLDIFELTAFVFSFWLLIKWGAMFYNSKKSGWTHPTSHGAFFISALLLGCSLLSMFNLIRIEHTVLQYFLIVLLILDLFIVYARFQYLTKFNRETLKIARKLMGKQILLFGTRIIMGIFMPLIFIFYMILINGDGPRGVEVLILIGILIDKFLFLTSIDLTD